jgi:hypothetical protein
VRASGVEEFPPAGQFPSSRSRFRSAANSTDPWSSASRLGVTCRKDASRTSGSCRAASRHRDRPRPAPRPTPCDEPSGETPRTRWSVGWDLRSLAADSQRLDRTITRLDVRRANNNAIWDTDGGTFYWALGASLGLDTPLLNAGNGAVNLAVTEGQAVYMFVSDFSPTPFSGGMHSRSPLASRTGRPQRPRRRWGRSADGSLSMADISGRPLRGV